MNVNENVSPRASTGEAKLACCDATWWSFVSPFVQTTVSPALTSTVLGTNALRVIATLYVAATAGDAVPSAAVAARRIVIFRIR